MRHWMASVHNGAASKASAYDGFISFAWRLGFSRASRFILSFICEYFFMTCASLWRRSRVSDKATLRDLNV